MCEGGRRAEGEGDPGVGVSCREELHEAAQAGPGREARPISTTPERPAREPRRKLTVSPSAASPGYFAKARANLLVVPTVEPPFDDEDNDEDHEEKEEDGQEDSSSSADSDEEEPQEPPSKKTKQEVKTEVKKEKKKSKA